MTDRVERVARALGSVRQVAPDIEPAYLYEARRFLAALDAAQEPAPMLPVTADAAGLVYLALSLAPGGTTHSVVEVREAINSAAKALAK